MIFSIKEKSIILTHIMYLWLFGYIPIDCAYMALICLQELLPEAHVHLFQQSGVLLLVDPRMYLYFIKRV